MLVASDVSLYSLLIIMLEPRSDRPDCSSNDRMGNFGLLSLTASNTQPPNFRQQIFYRRPNILSKNCPKNRACRSRIIINI